MNKFVQLIEDTDLVKLQKDINKFLFNNIESDYDANITISNYLDPIKLETTFLANIVYWECPIFDVQSIINSEECYEFGDNDE